MTTHAQAIARLTGADATHTLPPRVVSMLSTILADHPEDCAGVQHLQGSAACRHYRDALHVLGLGGAK